MLSLKVELKIQKPSREQCTFGTMTGCTGGGHPTIQSYNPFRGLHLIKSEDINAGTSD